MKRRKQTRKHLKLISVLLVLCLSVAVLFSAPMTVSAEDLVDVPQNEPILTVPVEEVQEVGFGEYAILEGEDEPERVPVQRLYSEEPNDLYTKVWLNNDGTRTMKLYDHPVKYVTNDGDIEDISLDVVASTTAVGGYETEAGFAKTVFPSKVTDGISLSGNGVSVKLTPVLPNSALAMDGLTANDTVTLVNNQTVSYTYDAKTSLDYKLTYMGFKEDIVVNEYTGQTQYTFMLETNGLTLVNENGSYFLKDETGEIKATLGDIIVFTADEQNNTMGEMTYTIVKPGYYYFLTIQLDAEWLSDENTAYPIRIDPTIELASGNGAIVDTTVSEEGDISGSSIYLHVGKRATYGSSRILMKFPQLNLNAIDDSINVISADLEIQDTKLANNGDLGIYSYIYDGNDWTETGATWSNNADGWTHFMSHNNISYNSAGRYTYDITNAVKYWIITDSATESRINQFQKEKGIMLKAKDTTENASTTNIKVFYSSNYSDSTKAPSLTITYNNNYDTYSEPFGWFDAVSATAISGWVWCFDAPNESLDVRIELENLDSTYAYTDYTVANIQRNDVAAAGYETGRYGFKYYINWNDHPAGEYRVKTYVKDYMADFYYLIDQSPRFYLNDNNLISTPNGVNYLHYGDSLQLSNTVDTTKFSIDWESSDGNLAIVDNNGLVVSRTKQNGDLSKKTGVVNITVVLTSNTTGSTHRRTFKLHVYDETGLSETEYYIMNSNSSKNLSLSYGSTSEGTNVITGIRSTLTSCQWKLDFLTNQKCTLTSVASSDGYKLNANGNNANLSGDSNQYTKQLTIYRYEDAASQYEGTFLVRYGKYYLTQASDNNAYWSSILLNTSYWSFIKVDSVIAHISSFTYRESINNATTEVFDSSMHNELFSETFDSLGYNSSAVVNPTPTESYSALQNSDVFVYAGHGNAGHLIFKNENGMDTGSICADWSILYASGNDHKIINSLSNNSLNSLRCVLLLACETAVDRTSSSGQKFNTLDAIYDKGAHFVLGTTKKIGNDDANKFLEVFCQFAVDGYNISKCVSEAADAVGWSTEETDNPTIICKGDMHQHLYS